MNKSKLNILFYLKRKKSKSIINTTILCRMTYLKKRKQFSTGQFLNPKNWNSKQQCVEPPEPDAELINTQLSLIKTKLSQAFLFLQVKGSEFDVDDIYKQYKGETPKKEFGVIEVYNLHSDRIKKLVDIDIKEVTYSKYIESGRHLKSFIKYKYKSNDIKLKTLKSSFLEHYEYYLKTEKKFQQSTLNKAIQRFRKVIKFAVSEDYLDKDPFILYRAKRVKKKVLFLSPEQLKKLEKTEFKIKRIQQIKEMFIFCCYTGLGFTEMKNLKKKDIAIDFDGELWLTVNRFKTNRSYKVPLLPKAQEISKKYNTDNSAYVFPSISNPNFNAYLKEIADIVGIEFNLTHHIARKTFASTVLLYNNVPIEVVSKLLGHSKIQTTQDSYGEIVEKRISLEMDKLKGK
ncbi:site-specific integrase [Winogradskyella sp. SYSU M77433]|uniref:site-specific integrase n=1 Tax=Winogradskyella sp. SYSU M77433 TaxID=3042722 RepID=UPI00248068E7|nr:site-specific integrase [Winogradskyella sp. SYSU M77433]MDH7912092.1 site-specific integrase [Winogradskyella sp. SYSU M77433]